MASQTARHGSAEVHVGHFRNHPAFLKEFGEFK